MRFKVWVRIPSLITEIELRTITASLNKSASQHNPPFGSLLIAHASQQHLNGIPLRIIQLKLQVQPASATSDVVESVIRAFAAWAQQIKQELHLSLMDTGEDGVLLTLDASETEILEIIKYLSYSLQAAVEAAQKEELPDLPESPTLEQIRQLITKTTKKKTTGLVRQVNGENGSGYMVKIDSGWMLCHRNSSCEGWRISQLTGDEMQRPTRIWTTYVQYAYLNLSLMLDHMLAVDPPGLEAEFSHAVIEFDTGVERKYYRTQFGLLVVHTRLLEVDFEQATELVVELSNPRQYLHRIDKRYAQVNDMTAGLKQISSLPF